MHIVVRLSSYLGYIFVGIVSCLRRSGLPTDFALPSQSVGVFFGVACMDFQVGNTVGAIFTCGTQLFGGFLSTHIPGWLAWMRYLSMVFYAYQNMQIVEFTNGAPFR